LVNAVTSALLGGGNGPLLPSSSVPEATPKEAAPDNSGPSNQNITRDSKKYTPETVGESPILFGTGTPGVDNGIRGWADGLKKLGIGGGGGGESTNSTPSGGGESEGGAK